VSNFLGIATVTATLSQMLQAAVGPDVPGATVTTLAPDEGGLPATGVNVFLYQVAPNASWGNGDLPTRRASGDLIQRPQAALNLYYLLTFYGAQIRLEPQRVLGSAVRAMHAQPILTRDLIRQTIAKPTFKFLVDSNLADSVELVKFTPLALSLEELSKLWSVYFQTKYSLSVAYQGTVVLIEGKESPRPVLPVRARNIYVAPFRQPFIEAVRAAAEPDNVIVSDSTLVITGQRLRGEATHVIAGGLEVTLDAGDVTDTRIRVKLPVGIRAGVQGVQVVQPRLIGTPPAEHRGVESNLAAIVLRPTINRKSDGSPDISVALPDVTVDVAPAVGMTQRAVLVLNELNPPAAGAARVYTFNAAPRHAPGDPPETSTIVFPIAGVVPGTYLVRVQVDGADSPLEQNADNDNPAYIGPTVTIP
jgi:hypothetical protein